MDDTKEMPNRMSRIRADDHMIEEQVGPLMTRLMNMIAVVLKERDLRVKRQESGYTVEVWLAQDPENKIRWITYEERRGRIEYGYYSDKSGPGEKPCEGSFDIQTEDPAFPLAQDGKLISLRDAAVIFLLPYMA